MATAPRPHGRPRSAAVDARVHAATIELLAEGGYDALTMTDVARRASTVPATLYRRHPNKDALVERVLREEVAAMGVHLVPLASLRSHVRAYVNAVCANFTPGRVRMLAGLLPAMHRQLPWAQAVREGFEQIGHDAWTQLVERAVARGEAGPSAATSLASQLASAMSFHQAAVLGRDLDDDFREHLVDLLIAELATSRPDEGEAPRRAAH